MNQGRVPTFQELEQWRNEIITDKVEWQKKVNKIKGKTLEAYQAGAEQATIRLLAKLREEGVLPEHYDGKPVFQRKAN